jgi:hypothetical protein
MKKILPVLGIFLCSGTFGIAKPTAEYSRQLDWRVFVTPEGIRVIDDNRTCIFVEVELPQFHATFTNCD